MTLIIILLCLGLERYFQIGEQIRNYKWFDSYFKFCQNKLSKFASVSPYLPIALTALPILLVVFLVQLFFNCILYGILGVVFNFVVLMYCLGSINWHSKFQAYFLAKQRGENEIAKQVLGIESDNPAEAIGPHTASQMLLKQVAYEVVSLLFWFVLFGAVGAVAYRFLLQLIHFVRHNETFHKSAVTIRKYMDWIPVRLLTICFALVGNFIRVFPIWLRKALSWPNGNQRLVEKTAFSAVKFPGEITPEETQPYEEALLLLADRAVIALLVVVGLMTLGGWIL